MAGCYITSVDDYALRGVMLALHRPARRD